MNPQPDQPIKQMLEKPVEEDMSVDSFDPWEPFQVYGSYSSAFDDMAIQILTDLESGKFGNESLADEMFKEMLCNLNLCDYGTSPRVCFPTTDFEKLLPKYIQKWKQYYEVMWERPWEPDDEA